MKITLAVKNQGHVPTFKNNKRAIQLKNGASMLVTEKRTKKWMANCIASFESQLFCECQTGDTATLTAPHQRSLIASSLPQDDSRHWIPELHVYAQEVTKGEEGAFIIIEPIE